MTSHRYEFRIAGHLAPSTREAFEGMTVRDAPPETVVRGTVVDDAHLHGVLALIQDLGLQVVAVQRVED
ncbi:hypothetical protein PSU4_13460 [Pseudonocardia sulfidoxydans NBRC 16205]|uniref:Uncharacterized protein n=1 Tax=Pseudonocardia sulfidoxydans NBRC 16205 TaxID=1223511 RepID=A0A511DC76_9PSEU|nr:hypothetical protein [Pseudonocardia sulfidoxydans]GEL22392.1 hypothetical protein PSU4_13460 [Pseudonocardia sulfidoxydans NBRC 16205]